MLLEELGYVVETASIFGRTTGDVHAMVNCYAPNYYLDLWRTLLRDAWRFCAAIYACWSLESVKSGEEWVKSRCKLFTPRNADKHRGFRRKGEE